MDSLKKKRLNLLHANEDGINSGHLYSTLGIPRKTDVLRLDFQSSKKNHANQQNQLQKKFQESSQFEFSMSDDDIDLDDEIFNDESVYNLPANESQICSISSEIPHEAEVSFFGELSGELPKEGECDLDMDHEKELKEENPFDVNITPIKVSSRMTIFEDFVAATQQTRGFGEHANSQGVYVRERIVL